MKTRKLLSAVLALALGLSLALPAAAQEAADQRLAAVTLAVKGVLDVEDDYTEFYGEPNETMLGTRWSLSWSGEDKSLSVSADDEGKILSMNRWVNVQDAYSSDRSPHFPSMNRDQARVLAEEFMAQVITEGETAVFDPQRESGSGLSVYQYGFAGSIYLNDTPAPLSFRVWVSVEQGMVTSFWRDDQSSYVGDIPLPVTVIDAEAARALLKDAFDMDLIYVRDGSDTAVLRYIPKYTDSYYVDAATGELVNLSELQRNLSNGGWNSYDKSAGLTMDEAASEMVAAPAQPMPTLTPTELEGVAKLEGVLTQEELSDVIKAWAELDLDDFEAVGCSYTVEREEPIAASYAKTSDDFWTVSLVVEDEVEEDEPANVTARLTFARSEDGRISRRYVTVDARTGELQNMSGYDPYREEPVKITEEEAMAAARAFLSKLWPEQLEKTDCYSSYTPDFAYGAYNFTFAQKVNGYFFPDNTLTVRVSADTGAIMGFSRYFDDDILFDDAEGLIDLDAAKTAWAASYTVDLAYTPVPVALDLLGPEVTPLRNAGYSWYNSLKPGYSFGRQEGWCSGVDAKTGQVVRTEYSEEQKMTYDDLEGHWAQAALTELALYDVGWYGGSAEPDKTLTQVEYVALLASMQGYRYDTDGDSADWLYSYAYRQGILTEEEREDDKPLARADMVELLLNFLGYRTVARLEGIFRCDFSDAEGIPAGHLGYAALAQGLGLVVGDECGRYAAQRQATRAEAAIMLWKYLGR